MEINFEKFDDYCSTNFQSAALELGSSIQTGDKVIKFIRGKKKDKESHIEKIPEEGDGEGSDYEAANDIVE